MFMCTRVCVCVRALVCEPMSVHVRVHLSLIYKIFVLCPGTVCSCLLSYRIFQMFSHFSIVLHHLCYAVLNASQRYTGIHARVCVRVYGGKGGRGRGGGCLCLCQCVSLYLSFTWPQEDCPCL